MSLRLFCLPHSGASAMVYGRWRPALRGHVDVRPVEIPGRGRRFAEAFADDIGELAGRLAQEIRGDLGPRHALFGHSLGALIAFEMAHALRALGAPEPAALIVSGTEAPSRRDDARYAGLTSDAALKERLRSLDGTPDEVLANEELMRLTLPVLRADFAMCARYRHRPRPPLDCPILVLGGRDDEPTPDQLGAWRQEGAGGFSMTLFDGGHFFLRDREADVLRLIGAALRPEAAAAAAL
ncbi:thioesterase II family protein [Azospirillum sp. ST 5-10]|uniref:thioesterase II family protein n=1 Tax=unclassified Azospirillum TaxID=2630922 RepID=UPI003F4A2D18